MGLKFVDLRKLRMLCGREDKPGQVSFGISLPKRELERAGWKEGDLIETWFDEERKVFVLKKMQAR